MEDRLSLGTARPREATLDIMKGLGILLIIYEHCAPISFEYKRFTMSFLMPMFFLVGGYLYRPVDSIKQDILKAGKRLVLPYIAGVLCIILLNTLVWHVMPWYQGFGMLFSAAGLEYYWSSYGSHWDSVGAFWFFMAMFWCRIIFNLIFVKTGRLKYPILTIVAVAGYLFLRYVIRLPLGISEGLSMMGFYLIGHVFRLAKGKYELLAPRTRRLWDIVLTTTVLILCIAWVWTLKHSQVVCSGGYYQHHLLNILCACAVTYVYYWFCKGMATHQSVLSRIFIFAGQGSLFLLWIHKVSLHYLFIWPMIGNIHLPESSIFYIGLFLLTQWIFCLVVQLAASQSRFLSDFFGIYSPHPLT